MASFAREVKRLVRRRPQRPAWFDAGWYLATNPDVAAAGADPLDHYLAHGRREGRPPCPLTAADRERDLRGGWIDPATGEVLLAGLAGDPAQGGAERVWAAVALARRLADRGDWPAANALLAAIPPDHDQTHPGQADNDRAGTDFADTDFADTGLAGFGLADPLLLAIEAAVVAGAPARAGRLLTLARRVLGRLPDLDLAEANLIAATTGFGPDWQRVMARVYRRAGLPGLRVADSAGTDLPALDRLGTAWSPLAALLPRFGSRFGARFGTRFGAGSGAGVGRGPLVSVIMPARNAAATIDAALDGLRAQSWRNLEILVVDNGSTDATVARVRHRAATDPRIRLIDGAAAPGAYAARNLGLAAARGDFITTHDADDWSHPARIARQVRALRRHPQAMACIAYWSRVTPDLRFTRWWRQDGHLHRNISSLMFRRAATEALGFWDRVRAGADSEYHARCLARFGADSVVDVLPGVPLTLGRRSATSLSRGEADIDSLHHGARRDYMNAASRWHGRDPAGLRLPAIPVHRAFAAPAALHPADLAPDLAPAPPLPDTERLATSPLFDGDWILRRHPALRRLGQDPVLWYMTEGASAGADPGPDFSASGWRLLHPGAEAGNPLLAHLDRAAAGMAAPPVLPDLAGDLPCPDTAPRVLFVGHQAGTHAFGAERSLLDTLDLAAGAGIVPLVVLPEAQDPAYLAAVRARSHRVFLRPFGWRYGGLAPDPAGVAHLRRILRDWRVAELHQNTAVVDIGPAAARAAGIPAVVHLRELPPSDPQLCRDLGLSAAGWRADLLADPLSGADRFVANSQAVADWIDAPGRVVILPNAIDPALLTLPWQIPAAFGPGRKLRLGLIGAIAPHKGLAAAMRLAQALARDAVPAEVVLVGPHSPALDALGPRPAALRHAGAAHDPAAALAGVDVVLGLSTVAESWGRSLAEGMAAGRPALVWDRGTPPDLIGRDGAAGLVLPADDEPALLAAVRSFAADPARLSAMSAAARQRARLLAQTRDTLPAARVFSCLATHGQSL